MRTSSSMFPTGALALALVAGLTACGEEARQAYSEAKNEVNQALDEARQGVDEAVGEAGQAWDAAKGDLAQAGDELKAAWADARGEMGQAMSAAMAGVSASSKDAQQALSGVVDRLEELKDQGVEMSKVPGQLLDSPEWQQLVDEAGGAWEEFGASLSELKNDPQLSSALDQFLAAAKKALGQD